MFLEDLKMGNQYELETLKFYTYTTYKLNNDYKYDLLLDDNIKIEVKADRMTYKTNNICIEYECNNKPSGISRSEASIYCYYVVKPDMGYDLYKIPVEDIKVMITNNLYKRSMNGGDGWRSKFYLFDISHFRKYQIII